MTEPNALVRESAPVTIAFRPMGSAKWQAGLEYLAVLLHALRETCPDGTVRCLLLTAATRVVPAEVVQLAHGTVTYPSYRRWTASWVGNRLAGALLGQNLGFNSLVRSHGVDIIAFGAVPSGSRVPSLGFIPDFQHVLLSDMFSAAEQRSRDDDFRRTAACAVRVVLLSESVRRDFQAFTPEHADKARVIKPVSHIPASAYEQDPRSVSDHYHLPEKFIYLPGQFWKHKNHRAAFQAVRLLKERGADVFLACSGYPGDYRHPAFFAELLEDISCLNLRGNIALLGMVPRPHVLALMRQSICVLNPSLFEGFGLTVDETRSLGARVVVSDIPAHREQDPPQAVYFEPRDVEDLAAKLGRVWREVPPGPDRALEREARAALPQRTRACAESFMAVVRECLTARA